MTAIHIPLSKSQPAPSPAQALGPARDGSLERTERPWRRSPVSEKQLRLAVHQGDIPALEAMKATLNDFHEDADAFEKMVNKLGLHSQAVRLAVRLREKADPEEQANLAKVLKVLKFLGKDTPPLDFGTLLAVYISFQWRALQAMLAADSSA